jgi:hypothetical protein
VERIVDEEFHAGSGFPVKSAQKKKKSTFRSMAGLCMTIHDPAA